MPNPTSCLWLTALSHALPLLSRSLHVVECQDWDVSHVGLRQREYVCCPFPFFVPGMIFTWSKMVSTGRGVALLPGALHEMLLQHCTSLLHYTFVKLSCCWTLKPCPLILLLFPDNSNRTRENGFKLHLGRLYLGIRKSSEREVRQWHRLNRVVVEYCVDVALRDTVSGHGGDVLGVGLRDLRGHFQPSWFCDSVSFVA